MKQDIEDEEYLISRARKYLAILYYNGPLAQLYFNGPGFFQQKPAVHWKCQNSIGDKWAIEV